MFTFISPLLWYVTMLKSLKLVEIVGWWDFGTSQDLGITSALETGIIRRTSVIFRRGFWIRAGAPAIVTVRVASAMVGFLLAIHCHLCTQVVESVVAHVLEIKKNCWKLGQDRTWTDCEILGKKFWILRFFIILSRIFHGFSENVREISKVVRILQ